MTHSRDHLTRENSRCRKGNICVYGFPRPLSLETSIDDSGRVHFRCLTEDDRWIAPHIPELIDELDCHIFVDIVFTVAVVTYLFKYLHKGPDQTWFHLPRTKDETHDEIKDYVKGRYLSAPEAAWRILGFDITSKEPSVTCLPIHLPGANIGQFTGQAPRQGATASLLMRYFHRPRHELFENMTYIDYFQSFILYKWIPGDDIREDEFLEEELPGNQKNRVSPRRTGIKVVRLHTIAPSAGELFYLRCILARKPGRSFEDIRTINGVKHPTFQQAALDLGLFANENEGHFAMSEAVASYCSPAQLRFLFARIMLEGYPAIAIWEEFKDELAKDFIVARHSRDLGISIALTKISEYINDGNHSMTDFGLPEPTFRTPEVLAELERYAGEQDSFRHLSNSMLEMMNGEQRTAYDTIINIINNHQKNPLQTITPIFIEGKPGRGKTFLLDAVCCSVRSNGLIVTVVGTSALAATLYEGGRTAHNFFQIPVHAVGHSSQSL
jgi:hypothetical protein